MRPGGTPEGIIVSGSNVDPVHSTDTRVPPGSEALPGLLLKFNIPPRLKWAKAVGLEFGHFERVTLPRDRCGFMVGSRFRVTGMAIPKSRLDQRCQSIFRNHPVDLIENNLFIISVGSGYSSFPQRIRAGLVQRACDWLYRGQCSNRGSGGRAFRVSPHGHAGA